MNDILGREIKIGDVIFHGKHYKSSTEYYVSKVVRQTEKTIFVRRLFGNRFTPPSYLVKEIAVKEGSHCVTINYEIEDRA